MVTPEPARVRASPETRRHDTTPASNTRGPPWNTTSTETLSPGCAAMVPGTNSPVPSEVGSMNLRKSVRSRTCSLRRGTDGLLAARPRGDRYRHGDRHRHRRHQLLQLLDG